MKSGSHGGAASIGRFAACVLVASAIVAAPVARSETAAAAAGTPKDPVSVYFEDFANGHTPTQFTNIDAYVGGSPAKNTTYSAAPYWADPTACNGYVMTASTPLDPACGDAVLWGRMQGLAQALARFDGVTASQELTASALVSGTSTPAGSSIGLNAATDGLFRFAQGHYYLATASIAAVAYTGALGAGCGAVSGSAESDPQMLLVIGGENSAFFSDVVDPCTAPGATLYSVASSDHPIAVARLTSGVFRWDDTTTDFAQVRLGQASQADTDGNDGGWARPTIVDVTPQLDKAFAPSTIAAGGTSTLSFTVTNTSELASKDGWSFHDNLPAGLTATGVSSSSCSGTVTAAAGASAVSASGGLADGRTSCTITVQVTASTKGAFANGPANFPAGTAGLNGLLAPGSATLTVTAPSTPSPTTPPSNLPIVSG